MLLHLVQVCVSLFQANPFMSVSLSYALFCSGLWLKAWLPKANVSPTFSFIATHQATRKYSENYLKILLQNLLQVFLGQLHTMFARYGCAIPLCQVLLLSKIDNQTKIKGPFYGGTFLRARNALFSCNLWLESLCLARLSSSSPCWKKGTKRGLVSTASLPMHFFCRNCCQASLNSAHRDLNTISIQNLTVLWSGTNYQTLFWKLWYTIQHHR